MNRTKNRIAGAKAKNIYFFLLVAQMCCFTGCASALPKDMIVLSASRKNIETEDCLSKEIFDLCNKEREAQGVPKLEWDDDLASCALERAEEASLKWSHTRPDGTEWWTIDKDIAYGENLARGYEIPKDCVDAWMESPAHKENVLDSEFKKVGIASYVTEDGKVYVAQIFGY